MGVRVILLATSAACVLCGCTGLEPAAPSAGASVAQTGVTIFDKGKARTVELAKIGDVEVATRRAVERLSLAMIEEEVSQARVRMVLRDERNDTIVVVLERHTATITQIQADVGVLGEIGEASLVVKTILAEIAAIGPPPRHGEGAGE